MVSENFAAAIINLIDSIGPQLVKVLPSPLNWLASGIFGFAKGLIEELLG